MTHRTMLGAIGVGLMLSGFGAAAQQPPFGNDDDVSYSKALWSALTEANLVGENRTMSAPYTGQHPHGAFLDTLDSQVSVEGTTGPVLIKRNYAGEGASKEAIWNDPGKYLQSVTVMFQREGYDPDNNDWFWVKYQPDGSLENNPKGVPLAGKVAKGMDKGCIACHTAAPGGDGVFGHDRYQ